MGYFIVTPEQAAQRRNEAERKRKLNLFLGVLCTAASILAAFMAVVSVFIPEAFLPYAVVILIAVTGLAAVQAVNSFRKVKEFAEQRDVIKPVWSGTVGRPSKEAVR